MKYISPPDLELKISLALENLVTTILNKMLSHMMWRQMQQTVQKKTPQSKFIVMVAIATAVILVFTVTPWNILPTSVTEQVQVIATTDYGCVAESVLGHSVVVENCQAIVGDVISATFYVPAMEQNGYYDKIHEKLEKVTP